MDASTSKREVRFRLQLTRNEDDDPSGAIHYGMTRYFQMYSSRSQAVLRFYDTLTTLFVCYTNLLDLVNWTIEAVKCVQCFLLVPCTYLAMYWDKRNWPTFPFLCYMYQHVSVQCSCWRVG